MKRGYIFIVFFLTGAFLFGVLYGLSTPVFFEKREAVPVMKQIEEKEEQGGRLVTASEVISAYPEGKRRYRHLTIALKFRVENYGQNIGFGDYFLYQLPAGYTLGNHFQNGKLRKKKRVIATYQRLERKEKEFVKITFTEPVHEEVYGQKLSGKMLLELDEIISE